MAHRQILKDMESPAGNIQETGHDANSKHNTLAFLHLYEKRRKQRGQNQN